MSTSRARFLAPFALAALSVGAALSLRRVFADDGFVLAVVGAAVGPFVVGALGRWRGWPTLVTLSCSTLALVAYVVWALEPSSTQAGLPLGDTWHAIATQLDHGWSTLRTEPAPAPTTDGAILLAVIATWVVSATADWLAFTRQAVLGALAPALVVFVWSSTLGTKEDWALTAAGFAVLSGCFLIAQNIALLERRRSWLVTRGRTRTPWLVPTALVSVVAVLGALALAPMVEDPDAGPLLDLNAPTGASSGTHSYNAGIAPLVDVGQKLRDTDVPDLFTVTSPVADYWRVTALDQFSSAGGGQWTLEAEGSGKVAVGLPDDVPAGAVAQRFSINDLGERWLPAAYRPVHISLPDTLVVVSSWTLVTSEDSVRRLDYTVDSVLGPAGSQITAEQQAGTSAPVPAGLRQFATLPSDFPPEITALAATIVAKANATTPYAKAAALRDWFRSPAFVYDTSVDLGDDADAILTFLRDKHGFCVQFASAYAVMARSLGIPTRLAVGYTSGTRAPDRSTYTVGSHDAHAWPEVWLAGLGWTHLFDPTPARSSARIGGSDLPDEPPVLPSPAAGETVTTVPPGTTPPPTSTPGGTGGVTNPSTATSIVPPTGQGAGGTTGGATASSAAPIVPTISTSSGSGSSLWRVVAMVAVVLLVLVGTYAGAVLALKRRRRARRRDATPTAAVEGAWAEALDRLREARVPPDPALTPLELARATPARTTPDAAPALRALARTYTTSRYGTDGAVDDDARRAWESVDELERTLDASVNRRERWRRRLDPTTLRVPTGDRRR